MSLSLSAVKLVKIIQNQAEKRLDREKGFGLKNYSCRASVRLVCTNTETIYEVNIIFSDHLNRYNNLL